MRVAVVCGGPSSEAEVSRSSARGVTKALKEAGHEATGFELNAGLAGSLIEFAPDVVFPVTHGTQGEDGCLQGLLEVLGLPFVGSGVTASAVAADKHLSKIVLREAGVPLAPSWTVQRGDLPDGDAEMRSFLARLVDSVGSSIVVKPAGGGSAIGVTRLETIDPGSLRLAAALAFEHGQTALLERFCRGAEVTCSVLENDAGQAEALPPTLIVAQAGDFYDFRSKYGTGGSRHECPAPFSVELTTRIQEAAVAAHTALGARDLSRADFIVDDDGSLVTLELNTLPGMTATSLFPEAAQAAGIAFADLCDRLARRAAARTPFRGPDALAMPD